MYWPSYKDDFNILFQRGCVKLPPINDIVNLKNLYYKCCSEMGEKVFIENSSAHKELLDKLDFDFYTNKLYEFAKENYNYQNSFNCYNISRKVEPNNKNENFRAHFDSHLFTVVFPINILVKQNKDDAVGELMYFLKKRENPTNSLSDVIGKTYHKRYASKKNFLRLGDTIEMKVDFFSDYRPLLFVGNTTLHTNNYIDAHHNENRLTFLTHICDPYSGSGVGSLLRKIRSR